MKVKICDHRTAALMSPKILGFRRTAMIRITAEAQFRPLMFPHEFVGVLCLQYGDVTDERWSEWNDSDEGRQKIADAIERGYYPTPITDEQARSVCTFIDEHFYNIDTLVVHCDAGISRSSATALAICEKFGLMDEYRRIEQDRWYRPNLTVKNRIREQFQPKADRQKMYDDLFGTTP